MQLAREAWMLASLDSWRRPRAAPGTCCARCCRSESLAPLVREASAQLARIAPEQLRRELPKITAGTAEAAGTPRPLPAKPAGE